MKSKTIILSLTISIILLYAAVTVSIVFISKGQKVEDPRDENPKTTLTSKTQTSQAETSKAETEPVQKLKRVAFTFDDGPHAERTYKFVNELKKYNGAATFFVVGNRIDANTGEAIKYACDNGCQIQIHAYTHKIMFDNCTDEEYLCELKNTEKAIKKYANNDIKFMRPPGGRISNKRSCSCQYSIILWSVDSNDWMYRSTGNKKQENINTIVNNVLSEVEDGDIILMHEIYENSFEAFCIIARELDKQGYEFVTVEELLGENIQLGEIYSSAKSA